MANIKLPFTTSHAFIVGINAYTNGVSPLTTAVKAKDRVIFYFAGHGIALDSEKDPEGFLVPADADQKKKESLISMNVLHETLHSLECKHGLLVLDCYFAGSFKWSTGFRDVVFNLADMLYEERFYRFVQHPAWQVITSSAHDQKALDIINEDPLGKRESNEDNFNSPFAKALKQAINLEGKADVVRGVFILDVCHGAEILAPLAKANHSSEIQELTHSVFALSGASYGQLAKETIHGGFFRWRSKNVFRPMKPIWMEMAWSAWTNCISLPPLR